MPRPVVGITMGDPAGIGPEIIVKALRLPRVHSVCRPTVFGTSHCLKDATPRGSGMEFRVVDNPDEASPKKGIISIVEIQASRRISVGKKSISAGKAALAYIDKAIEAAVQGKVDALVTAPVSKAAIRKAGAKSFIGHTEYLADKGGAKSVAMMFFSRRLKVVLVTTHLPLRKVASAISTEKILNVISLANKAMKKLGCAAPRIGVAGLNPHAGEDRAFGDEDASVIAPAVRAARRRGIDTQGPLPADTLFHAAYRGNVDLVVAMYHDQALAPFKMIAFDEGVNITLGLPFVRTSVDHGTAFDIAGKGIASEKSLVEAIKLAAQLAK